MKALKLISIAVLLATAIVNSAQADIPKINTSSNIIKITFVQAMQSPGLVGAMHQQLNGAFLGGPGTNLFTLRVTFQGHVYLITGTRTQWNIFFNYGGITEKPVSVSISKKLDF